MSEATIFALSSGVGRSGVAVIRVSGPAAFDVVRQLCRVNPKPRIATISDIYEVSSSIVIDRGLILCFAGPKSFTGEDVAEFHVHGGRAVVSALLRTLSDIPGLRAAGPGEFTRRAFENGKLDLTSAEGLADLISADTEYQRRQAIAQFSGRLGEAARNWRRSLIDSQALIEAYLDFPDEGEIPLDISAELDRSFSEVECSLSDALKGYSEAEIVRDGAIVLIAGPPNSGKSSLLNRIASREVAIISEIPGTTRDLIELTIDINGLPFTFIDSAGIRDTTDPIERQGIEKTLEKAAHAHIVLWLSPIDQPLAAPEIQNDNLWIVKTKSDLADSFVSANSVSALTGVGVRSLLNALFQHFAPTLQRMESSLLVSRRQFVAISSALKAVEASRSQLDCHNLELVAEELRRAALDLDELVGNIASDEILSEVFSRFCLGK